MKDKIKIIVILILGIIVSVIINVYSITKIKEKEVIHKETKELKSTSDPDYINGIYSSSSTINSNISAIKTLYSYSGAIFITTSSSVNNTVLNAAFGGTWTKVTSDAYFKIVSSSAGSLGGTSSNHKIPISSMPAHTHGSYSVVGTSGNTRGVIATYTNTAGNGAIYQTLDMASTGGGQAYYPYYYGIYVWKRS